MLRRKPTIPKTLDHWFQDPVTIDRLRNLLADPVFQTASCTLLAAAQPSYRNLAQTEQNSLRQAWLAGYNDFANDLLALTKAPPQKGQMPEEWSHFE